MRADGRDIIELFGYAPTDVSVKSAGITKKRTCPFTSRTCSKTNHDQSEIYGVCAVSKGANKEPGAEIIVCPTRLYANKYAIFQDVIDKVWSGEKRTRIVGGDLASLRKTALSQQKSVVAFGQNSGREIQTNSYGKLSLDWVLQAYNRTGSNELEPLDFVGVEIQSLDITGNYRDNWQHYIDIRAGDHNSAGIAPDSGHGLNWANVHKRLIPQLIRKGNIYAQIERCKGFYFLLPDGVYKKFEEVIGTPKSEAGPNRANISILTYVLGDFVPNGSIRKLIQKRELHFSLENVKDAFINRTDPKSPDDLDSKLKLVL